VQTKKGCSEKNKENETLLTKRISKGLRYLIVGRKKRKNLSGIFNVE